MNYLTAQFALEDRGDITEDDAARSTAAGGVGTPVIQVAKGDGAPTIPVHSTETRRRSPARPGATPPCW